MDVCFLYWYLLCNLILWRSLIKAWLKFALFTLQFYWLSFIFSSCSLIGSSPSSKSSTLKTQLSSLGSSNNWSFQSQFKKQQSKWAMWRFGTAISCLRRKGGGGRWGAKGGGMTTGPLAWSNLIVLTCWEFKL